MLRFLLAAAFATALCGSAHAQYFDGLPVAGSSPQYPAVSSSSIVPICGGGVSGRPGTCKPEQTTAAALMGAVVSSLPTALPAAHCTLWNNGGLLSITTCP